MAIFFDLKIDVDENKDKTLWVQSMEARYRFNLTLRLCTEQESFQEVTLPNLKLMQANMLGDVIAGSVSLEVNEHGTITIHSEEERPSQVELRLGEGRQERILLTVPPGKSEIGSMEISQAI